MQRFVRVITVAMLVGITFLYPLAAPPAHRIDDAHRESIRTGMTRADVEEIFGVSAGAYDGISVSPLLIQQSFFFNGQKIESPVQVIGIRNDETSAWWIGREGAYVVRFNDAARVIQVDSFPRPIVQPLWRRAWSMARRACGMDD